MHAHVDSTERSSARHLWGQFSPMVDVPIIARGEGCHVWDIDGHQALDGLAGLFAVQVGHGRTELADVAREQMRKLAYFPLWGYAHEPGLELAERLAHHAPADLNRVFFTSSGSEAVESALKLARQYYAAVGEPTRFKAISRDLSYHGTTLGALSIGGLTSIQAPFEPLLPGAITVPHTRAYDNGSCGHDGDCLCAAEDIDRAIRAAGPSSVAAVFLEPVQNAGGCLVPPPGYFARVREICDEHGVLLVADEVICAFGRLGHTFASERYGIVPDMITIAKGLTSGYAPLGALLASDRLAEPFEHKGAFTHGFTYSGHPVACTVASKNLDLLDGEALPTRVLEHERKFARALSSLCELEIVGDVRGAGYFWAVELVKDRATGKPFDPLEGERLSVRLREELYRKGLVCRCAFRGAPLIQLSPPLIAGEREIDEMVAIIHDALAAEQAVPRS